MKLLSLLLLLPLVIESEILDNNQFLIYNKRYHKARLAQWGNGGKDVGTYEKAIYSDQLWTLEPHPTKTGCYYLVNEKRPDYRIADASHRFVVFNGPYYDDQLFRFEPSGNGDGYYYIISCRYKNDRMAKYGHGNRDVVMYSGPRYQDQLWRLVPRFTVSIHMDEVFHFDNRQGSSPVPREITVTTGIRKSSTKTIRNKQTLKTTMEASMEGAFKGMSFGAKASTEITKEIETTFSETSESNWSKTDKMKFTVPAGKNYKVMQRVVKFKSKLPGDSYTLLSGVKVFESNTAHFVDNDHFIFESHSQ
jgi:hypothetical protein